MTPERPRAYTMDELERLSGIDRRTIAYYVQEGLLPRVGRRGPRTRYPQLFLDRLLFIRRLREREEAGEVTQPMTLADIRELFEAEDEATIAAVAAEREPEDKLAEFPGRWAAESLPEPEGFPDEATGPAPAMAPPSRRARAIAEHHAFSSPGPDDREGVRFLREPDDSMPVTISQEPPERRLGRLLARLEESTGRRRWGGGRGAEQWTRANVTPGITISARNLDEDDAPLLEHIADILRRMMWRRGGS